ncbi:hypothetical protein ACP70R_002693 [Stipagrostis hirtigluma subsp. patula]
MNGCLYSTLLTCDHSNILKPLGVWKSPMDDTKAYLVLEEVQGPLIAKGKECILSMEGSNIYGFSDIGFKAFRELFSVVDYVNNLCQSATSNTNGPLPLMSLKLSSSNIFYKLTAEQEVQVVIAEFLLKHPQNLLKKHKRAARTEPTIQDVQQYNWSQIGQYLSKFCEPGTTVNLELKQLALFLKGGAVRYGELLWQPGIWEASVKLRFIREIYWIMDRQRGLRKTVKLENTEKAKDLQNIKHPLGILSCVKDFTSKELKEETLFDSLVHLRVYIVAHYHESYLFCPEDDIGYDMVRRERLVQKANDQNSYMGMFYEIKKQEISEGSFE